MANVAWEHQKHLWSALDKKKKEPWKKCFSTYWLPGRKSNVYMNSEYKLKNLEEQNKRKKILGF